MNNKIANAMNMDLQFILIFLGGKFVQDVLQL